MVTLFKEAATGRPVAGIAARTASARPHPPRERPNLTTWKRLIRRLKGLSRTHPSDAVCRTGPGKSGREGCDRREWLAHGGRGGTWLLPRPRRKRGNRHGLTDREGRLAAGFLRRLRQARPAYIGRRPQGVRPADRVSATLDGSVAAAGRAPAVALRSGLGREGTRLTWSCGARGRSGPGYTRADTTGNGVTLLLATNAEGVVILHHNPLKSWWAIQDSNLWPLAPEACTPTPDTPRILPKQLIFPLCILEPLSGLPRVVSAPAYPNAYPPHQWGARGALDPAGV